MKDSVAVVLFLVEIGAMVEEVPEGGQVVAVHGVLQGRLLACHIPSQAAARTHTIH